MMLGLHLGERALVISAHPEDAMFGMGGTIAVLAVRGITVDVLAVTADTCDTRDVPASAETRQREFAAACDALGVHARRIAWADDGADRDPSTGVPRLVTQITQGPGPSLATTRPAALFIPAGGHHQDHKVAHQAALAALRQRPNEPHPRLVFGYGDPADQSWLCGNTAGPALVDITGTTQAKHKALERFTTLARTQPHPRSWPKIQAMDQATGAAARTQAAERFTVYQIML